MNAEFNWWLLIVGVAAGAGLAWLTLSDWGRREEDLELDERAIEAAWIADVLRDRGEDVDPLAAEEILALHRSYLQQAGLFDPTEAESGSAAAPTRGADDPTWGQNEWAHETWDDEASDPGATAESQALNGPGGQPAPARRSIRTPGSAAPRGAAEARNVGSEPPQA